MRTAQIDTNTPYKTVDGLVGLDHQLRSLEALLRSNWQPERAWLIDNGEIVDLEEDDLERLVALVRSYPGKLEDLAVAWVTPQACAVDPRLLQKLPFAFRVFDAVGGADQWLRQQLASESHDNVPLPRDRPPKREGREPEPLRACQD